MGTEELERIGPFLFRNIDAGQRITTDTLLLSEFVLPLRPTEKTIELGTGTAPLPLILCWKTGVRKIVALEVNGHALKVAEENIVANNLADRVELLCKDWRELKSLYPQGSFQLVVSNPPYVKKGGGRISPHHGRAVARCEIFGTLEDLVDTSTYLVSGDGRICYIYPVRRFLELTGALEQRGFGALRVRFVHTGKDRKATLFMIEARRGNRLTIEEPLFL